MSFSAIHDPLTINLHRQTQFLISKLPTESPYTKELLGVEDYADLLKTLSRLLSVPSLTMGIASAFRPMLLDLCARWLVEEEEEEEDVCEERLIAICMLVEVHEELFP
jgi:midasin